MTKKKRVKCTQDGILVSISEPSKQVFRVVSNCLTYQRMEYDRKNNRRDPRTVRCYEVIQDKNHGVVPPQVVFAAGMLPRVAKALSKAGYSLGVKKVKGLGQASSDQASVVDWSRVADVDWRWMQKEILNHLLPREMGQVKVAPGYGKSFLIAAIADMAKKARIVVTSHRVDVVKNLHRELSSRLPLVGLIGGGQKTSGDRVVCVSGKSLHKVPWPADILMLDEAHEFGTDDYMEKLSSPFLQYAKRYGFSANVGDRTDGADFEIEAMFGPCIVDLSYQECVDHGCVVPMRVHWTRVTGSDPVWKGAPTIVRDRACLWQNRRRNQAIADNFRRFPGDEQQLIVVDKVEHAVNLKALLPECSLVYSAAGMSDADRRKYISQGLLKEDEPPMTNEYRDHLRTMFERGELKHVIATGVWNQGVNFRRLSVLHRADAAASRIPSTQIPCRASRLCEETGKQYGYLCDYFDEFNHTLRRRSETRKGHYADFGWEQSFDPFPSSGHSNQRQSLGAAS